MMKVCAREGCGIEFKVIGNMRYHNKDCRKKDMLEKKAKLYKENVSVFIEKKCARDGCDVVFKTNRSRHIFHNKECADIAEKDTNRKYRIKNQKRIRAYQKKWSQENREKINLQNSLRRRNDPDNAHILDKRRREKNREKLLKYKKIFYQKNKAKHLEYQRKNRTDKKVAEDYFNDMTFLSGLNNKEGE